MRIIAFSWIDICMTDQCVDCRMLQILMFVYLSNLYITPMQMNGAGSVVVTIDGVVARNGWLKTVSYLIVVLNLSSRDGVAKTLIAALCCQCVRFKVFVSLLLDQLVSVSPRLVGPYNGGGGFQVLWSSAKRYVCSLVQLLVGGLGLSIGVDLVLPGWLDGNLISGIKDDGDKAVFLGGCREFVSSTCGTLTEVFDDDVWFDLFGVVLPLTDCGDVADQRELLGECNGCARKCSWTK